jgi:biotin carboxyl carrier protein
MTRLPRRLLLAVLACAAMAGATGCGGPKTNDPVAVAQVAVRANPDLELMATDERQGVLTVKMKRTGRIVTVRADDVVAGTAFRDLETAPAAPSAAPMPAATATPAAPSSETTPAGPPETPAPVSAPRPSGSTARPTAHAGKPVPAGAAAEGADHAPSIDRSKPASDGTGANIDVSRLQRRPTPVGCSANETVHLEGVLIEADRAAVDAVGNCQVVITNSRIVGRVGVVMAGNATVTIENSIVEGTVAIQALANSTATVRSSTIIGRVQRLQSAAVRDLGQNVWR